MLLLLERHKFRVKVKADLGITFDIGSNGTVSILKSGVMIIEDIKNEEKAYDLYRRIAIDGLKIPRSNIE